MNSFWKDQNVAVTGATGMVGSWLVKQLLADGANVSALIFKSDPLSELIRSGDINRISCVEGDLRDINSISELVETNNAETIFHLGAQTIVGEALLSPLETFESNILGTWNLMEVARRKKSQIKRVLIASSDKAYGTASTLPYDESTALKGESPYDVSKSCTDLIAHSYYKTYQVPTVIARCGNIYGGGDLNWSRIVPGTIKDLIEGKIPQIRSNGKFLRDYIYVEDAVHAYLKMAECIDSGTAIGESFNFSREEPIDVLTIYKAICIETVGKYVVPDILNSANNEIIDQHLSSSKARTQLNWESKYSLSEGIKLTVEWYKKYLIN